MLNPYTFLLKTETETSSKVENLLGRQGKASHGKFDFLDESQHLRQ